MLLHLPRVLFQPREVRPHQFQNLVPLLPSVQHTDFRNGLSNSPPLPGRQDSSGTLGRGLSLPAPGCSSKYLLWGNFPNTIDKLLHRLQDGMFPAFSYYYSYYRRKSCVLLLSTLSIFDMHLEREVQNGRICLRRLGAPLLFSRRSPCAPLPVLQEAIGLDRIYIKQSVITFYEELSTLSTEFSTRPPAENPGTPLTFQKGGEFVENGAVIFGTG